jgi:hypothetical protein
MAKASSKILTPKNIEIILFGGALGYLTALYFAKSAVCPPCAPCAALPASPLAGIPSTAVTATNPR